MNQYLQGRHRYLGCCASYSIHFCRYIPEVFDHIQSYSEYLQVGPKMWDLTKEGFRGSCPGEHGRVPFVSAICCEVQGCSGQHHGCGHRCQTAPFWGSTTNHGHFDMISHDLATRCHQHVGIYPTHQDWRYIGGANGNIVGPGEHEKYLGPYQMDW